MRQSRWLLTVAAVCLGAAIVSAAPSMPVAMLAAVRGDVHVTAGGKGAAKRGGFGQALAKGDRVAIAAGGAATLVFQDGSVVELGENSSVTVGAGGEGRGKSEIPGEVYTQVSRYVTGGSRETGLVALSGMRGGEASAPMMVAPRKTAVLSTRPAFSWRSIEGATRYRVTLSSDEGELWSEESNGASLSFPNARAELQPGADYVWELEARSDTRSLGRESASFHVMAAEESKAVIGHVARIESAAGAESPAGHFLAGSYLSGKGLYEDAAERFRALVRLAPDSPDAHEALAGVYAAVGLTDLAAAEYRSALELTRAATP